MDKRDFLNNYAAMTGIFSSKTQPPAVTKQF